jgi:hypothetical protein
MCNSYLPEPLLVQFVGLAYQGKDIVFGFIIKCIVAYGILAP